MCGANRGLHLTLPLIRLVRGRRSLNGTPCRCDLSELCQQIWHKQVMPESQPPCLQEQLATLSRLFDGWHSAADKQRAERIGQASLPAKQRFCILRPLGNSEPDIRRNTSYRIHEPSFSWRMGVCWDHTASWRCFKAGSVSSTSRLRSCDQHSGRLHHSVILRLAGG